jgi:hypothetical protein
MIISLSCLHCKKRFNVQANSLMRLCPKCYKLATLIICDIVKERSWRYEDVIIYRMLARTKWDITYQHGEDLLYLLVLDRKLEWFGAEEEARTRPDLRPSRFEGMLKYRIPSK